MDSAAIIQALVELWDDLPVLVGPAWDDLFVEITRILDQLKQANDLGRQSSLTADLMLVFRPYPAVRHRLRTAADAVAAERNQVTKESIIFSDVRKPSSAWSISPLEALDAKLDAPALTRYTDIAAPKQLPLAQRGVITVALTRSPAPDSVDAQPLTLAPGEVDVYLHAAPEAIELLGERVKTLRVDAVKEDEPVVFYIKGRQPGDHEIRLEFYQAGVTVGMVRLAVEVVEAEQPAQTQSVSGMVPVGGTYAPPPDLDIRVTLRVQDGQMRLNYVLHSPNGAAGFHYHPVPGPAIQGDPKTYQANLMRKIEAYAAGRDVDGSPLDPDRVENKLKALGRDLYQQLFSPEMRSAYRRFREKVKTLLITSDEPWIPWEMIRPYDDADPEAIIDDDFLCMTFQLTRWLAGQRGPAGKIEVAKLACVEAGQALQGAPLKYAQSERKYFADWVSAYPGIADVSPEPAALVVVEDLLDAGGVSLWHFAAHGNIDFSHVDQSVLVLEGGQLRAEDIHGPRQTHIARDRPLVFLNACRVGQQGWALTQLGGWARRWVNLSRCGAFVGPLWSVNDFLAYEFAVTFYDALRRGEAAGKAVQLARQRLRDLRPENPTWLAYSVYAHPNARVRWPAD